MREILRARFVVENPDVISDDSALLIENGKIVDKGKYAELKSRWNDSNVREFDGVISAGLINGHTHLELSTFRNIPHVDFVDWVLRLVEARSSFLPDDIIHKCLNEKHHAESKGTSYFVNVGNIFEMNVSLGRNQLFQFEQIGMNPGLAEGVFDRASTKIGANSMTAMAIHAPYSVSPALMKKIKSYNNSRGMTTSIHISETPEEVEFIRSGGGRMTHLLDVRVGKWDFTPAGASPVRYIDSLGILDGRTLCVHSVIVDDEDVRVMSRRGCAVCICVRSNRELSGSVPPVGKFVESGIRMLLGTDSLASSPSINMFDEAAAFYDEFHGVFSPGEVYNMITAGAAEFLGLAGKYGSLDIGAAASIVYVPFDGPKENVLEYFVSEGRNCAGAVEI